MDHRHATSPPQLPVLGIQRRAGTLRRWEIRPQSLWTPDPHERRNQDLRDYGPDILWRVRPELGEPQGSVGLVQGLESGRCVLGGKEWVLDACGGVYTGYNGDLMHLVVRSSAVTDVPLIAMLGTVAVGCLVVSVESRPLLALLTSTSAYSNTRSTLPRHPHYLHPPRYQKLLTGNQMPHHYSPPTRMNPATS